METFGIYLIKSSVWLIGFTLIYFIFLRNERFFSLNRAFLLSGIFVSIVFPFFTWHYAVILPSLPVEQIPDPQVAEQLDYLVPDAAPAAPAMPFYWWFYIFGMICLVVRLIFQTIKLVIRLRKTEFEKNGPVKLVRTPEYPASFSFFSYVFVNPSTPDTETREILNHESGHIQNRHWFDLLLMEILRILQWFNPFVWIYANFVRQNHEYMADELALRRTSDPAIYRAALLNQVLGVPVFSLANSFSYSLNQKRFAMMKKRIQSPLRKLKVLLVLPLIAAVFYAFAKPEYIESPAVSTENISSIAKESKVKGTVTNEKGNPLKGVSVIIKGTTIGTITDDNGDFVLKDVAPDAELAFSYVGLKSKILKADFDTRMKIVMGSSTVAIEPVFVGENPGKYEIKGSSTADQSKTPVTSKGNNQFLAIEQMPQFPGGYNAMMQFLLTNIKYPPESRAAGKEGTVLVNFQVNPRGKIKDARILESVDPALDAEALRVVNAMPDWNPGKQNGKAVEVGYSIPVQFSLTAKSEKDYQPKVLVRASGTASGAEPIFIIDGGEIMSKKEFDKLKLDPSTIESISVLKEKSATAVWGEKGANGVILITTKKGLSNSSGKTAINVDGKEATEVRVVGYGRRMNLSYFYKEVDVKPQFPGGIRVMFSFLAGNMKYPVIASENGITGSVLVRFTVKKSGQIENVNVVNDPDPSLKEEAIRVVKRMPVWDPGKLNGQAVDVVCSLPVKFILSGQKSPESVDLPGDFGQVVVAGFGNSRSGNNGQDTSYQFKKAPPVPFINGDSPFVSVEQMPEFPGGQTELRNFIMNNMKYPTEAAAQGIQGTVVVQFVVTKTGKLDNFRVIRGVNPSLDEEALRVIKASPDWKPGMQGGKPVNVYYTLPFVFVLSPPPPPQMKNDVQSDDEKTALVVEQMPEFPGGSQELMRFISSNIKYPEEAKKLGIQGKVILQFVVTKAGKIENIKVARGIGSGCDEEAVRVLKLSPDWIPGKQGGKPVNVMYTLPVVFKLG